MLWFVYNFRRDTNEESKKSSDIVMSKGKKKKRFLFLTQQLDWPILDENFHVQVQHQMMATIPWRPILVSSTAVSYQIYERMKNRRNKKKKDDKSIHLNPPKNRIHRHLADAVNQAIPRKKKTSIF